MPIYDYECTTCDCIFDVTCSIEKRNSQKCPKCGGKSEIIIGAPPGYVRGTSNPVKCSTNKHSDNLEKRKKKHK